MQGEEPPSTSPKVSKHRNGDADAIQQAESEEACPSQWEQGKLPLLDQARKYKRSTSGGLQCEARVTGAGGAWIFLVVCTSSFPLCSQLESSC